ncbi:hypothetical protein [Streptomyces sp. IMTB 2501]|uniref:hypothetical protein n=1 Tax=Streptomyces sp. IMTB 2501 TaxID=1776340 RepID=UPI0021166B73|nr:hypothetical protein [Streptomyces sp. IMTB 2501]
MDNDLVQRARWGDLAGQNWAGLVRLSFEVDEGPGTGDTHARSMIRISTGLDGTEISPMRAAEARLTLGVAAARMGEIEEAIGMGTRALEADRKSLPSLLLVR